MKKSIALLLAFFMMFCTVIPSAFAEDSDACAHEWEETGVLCPENVHDGSDKIVCYRCKLCGAEKTESVPTDIPAECLYEIHDTVCPNGATTTTAVCIYCGNTRVYYTTPDSVYTDENGNKYSYTTETEDAPDAVSTETEDAAESVSAEAGDEPVESIPTIGLDGGWAYLACSNAVDEHANAVFEQAKLLLTDGDYTLYGLLGTQVVAGTNYCFLTFKTSNAADVLSCYSIVYVYEDLSGAVSVLSVLDIGCSYDFAEANTDETATEDSEGDVTDTTADAESAADTEAEAPVVTAEEPAATEEAPVVTAEEPAATEEEAPVATAEEPAATEEAPVATAEEPAATEEEAPVATAEEPAVAAEEVVDTADQTVADGLLSVVDETTGAELFSAFVSEDGLTLNVSLLDDSESNFWRCSIGDLSILQLVESALTDAADASNLNPLTGIYTALFKARQRTDGTYRIGATEITFALVKNSTDKTPLTSFTLIVSVDENGLLTVSAGDVPYTHIY